MKPKARSGADAYSNIVVVSEAIKPLITARECVCEMSEECKEKLNRLRTMRKLRPVD